MDTSVYTLLIVESPTIAGIVQRMCPSSVYVVSTDGYCWRPKYDFSTLRMKAVADPDKRDIRKELKEQSKIASMIVIAADSDASGDFIAWSVSRFIKSSNIKRGRLQNLSKKSIYSMLDEALELDETRLETRLKNRYLIYRLWPQYAEISDMQLAGLISVFGTEHAFQSFLDERNSLYGSTSPVRCRFDEWISIRAVQNSNHYQIVKPLSTFDVLEYIPTENLTSSYYDAQLLLQQLFQTVLPFSGESLISYPRTSARAFYSDTWNDMRRLYLKIGSVNELKPIYLQEIADTELPHEGIHPVDLTLEPDFVSGELPKNIGKLYQWIYEQTIKTLSMPKPLEQSFMSDLNPDTIFYPESAVSSPSDSHSIRPCLTLSDLGIRLNEIGVAKPSDFGKTVDSWISKEWIRVENSVALPGRQVLKNLDAAVSLHQKLKKLNHIKEESALLPETVVEIITS